MQKGGEKPLSGVEILLMVAQVAGQIFLAVMEEQIPAVAVVAAVLMMIARPARAAREVPASA